MSNYRAQFENELREKLTQKSTAHMSEETVLLRAFKYFDLDNSGCVSLNEWVKAIEKIGVVVENPQLLEQLFRIYDTDRSGELDYQEFAASIFGAQSASGRRLSPTKGALPSELQEAEQVIEKLRQKLAARGGRGILGLARQFKIMDDDNSQQLSLPEFSKAMRDFRVELTERETSLLFNYCDRNRSGEIDYDEFLRAVRGPVNSFRRALVNKAFDKLDYDRSGVIDLTDIRHFYNAKGHPDVRSGRKSEEEVLGEFLETFEMHRNILGTRDRVVTREEFEEYYNNISMSIDNDQYFELMMNNTWKLTEAPAFTQNKAWTNAEKGDTFARAPTRGAPAQAARPSDRPAVPRGLEGLLENFRAKVMARGARGIIGIQRQFKIIDDDNSKNLSLGEFRKACRDFRIEVSDEDVATLFRGMDRDRNGTIDYDELIRAIRGPMNPFRKNIVSQAWNKIDRDKSGILDIDDLKGVYNARSHPDVRSGKRTEDDVLGEFLETFETHHNISDLSQRDRRVTKEEFEEYYNNVSASIDDDKYFELMMTNAWKLNGETARKDAWSSDYSFARGARNRPPPDRSAPYGTTDAPIDWTTANRPQTRGVDLLTAAREIPVAGAPTWTGGKGDRPSSSQGARGVEELMNNMRNKLASRGARGFIGLSRQFKIMDDNNSKTLDYPEFSKAIRDFRIDISEEDARRLFMYMDADRNGCVEYEEFVHRIRGDMNDFRKGIVQQAFRKLDKTGDGRIQLEDIKGVYNASNHPDVRSGKKTEDEVLCDFLDTFEIHHSLYVRFT
jgi:Ca2+-binding EF-hand superfamily protein